MIFDQTIIVWTHFYTLQYFEKYSRTHFKQGLNIYKNHGGRELIQQIQEELSEILISDWLAVQSTIEESLF